MARSAKRSRAKSSNSSTRAKPPTGLERDGSGDAPALQPDAPGEGINRKRPMMLFITVTAFVVWLIALAWMAAKS